VEASQSYPLDRFELIPQWFFSTVQSLHYGSEGGKQDLTVDALLHEELSSLSRISIRSRCGLAKTVG